jgi:hypothetical protein
LNNKINICRGLSLHKKTAQRMMRGAGGEKERMIRKAVPSSAGEIAF